MAFFQPKSLDHFGFRLSKGQVPSPVPLNAEDGDYGPLNVLDRGFDGKKSTRAEPEVLYNIYLNLFNDVINGFIGFL